MESLQKTPTLMSSPPMAYPVDKEYYVPTPVLINVLSRIWSLVVEYSADYPASGVLLSTGLGSASCVMPQSSAAYKAHYCLVNTALCWLHFTHMNYKCGSGLEVVTE